jgi:HAD superfamily hydrolase (TIGR01509 family)
MPFGGVLRFAGAVSLVVGVGKSACCARVFESTVVMLRIICPRAVIFDMDGLLLDSERVALALLAQAAREVGAPWDEVLARSLVGISARDSDQMIVAALGADFPIQAHRQRFGELYAHAIASRQIQPKPFVKDLLEALKEAQIPCAVATSTRRDRAEAKLHVTRLLPYFKALACGDEVLHGKPAPEIFELAARRAGVEPRRCLALEDSNPGVRAAVSAGMQVVMIPDMVSPDADIACYGVPIVDSLKDVLFALVQ